jgi:peptide/nickel transport system permease protein
MRVIGGRLLGALAVVWAVVTAAFVAVHALPGGPARALLSPRATPAQIRAFDAAWGLSRPWWIQYADWWIHAVRGEFGLSYATSEPVAQLLAQAIPRTLALVGLALGLGLVAGVALALFQATRAGSRSDRAAAAALGALYAAPPYWVGVGLLSWLAEGWHILPAGGTERGAVLLPAFTLSIPVMAAAARYLRNAVGDLPAQPWWRAAQSRGVSARRLWLSHGLRHGAVPVVLCIGWLAPQLVAGSVVVEALYNYPGLGWVLWQAALARDVPVILGGTAVLAVFTTVISALADVVAALLDRRRALR